ncbi:MAG: hypothetical protein AAFW75_18510, partial [Cyanobacteria bacterium J06636_16]
SSIDLPETSTREPSRLLWPRVWHALKAYLQGTGRSLVAFLCGSHELHIATKRDREGNDYFVAYDPVTQTRLTFTSERELRVWLDKRYYQ